MHASLSRHFFQTWDGLLRTLLVGVLAYTALVVLLRVAGKRTLAKMNAFDFVVTIAIGSTLATVLLNKNVALVEGVVALGLLLGLQFAVTWSSVRIAWVRRWVTGEPQLILHGGVMLTEAARRARVTESEVDAAIRGAGLPDRRAVDVVLETDGSFSVIPRAGAAT